MDEATRAQIARLAQEGKSIADIWREDFPEFDYDEVYWAARGGGQRSARGMKRMITARLKLLADAEDIDERDDLIDDISELVSHLYRNHKANARKLEAIRTALDR